MKIAVASGKGGTGKTTLATNLAHYLSRKRPVLLADLDVEEPNAGLFIKGQPAITESITRQIPEWNTAGCRLCGLCQQVCNFNAVARLGTEIMVFPELCHSCYLCSDLCPDQALPMVAKEMGTRSRSDHGQLVLIESRLNIGEEQAVPLIKDTLGYLKKLANPDQLMILDAPPGTSCPVIEVTRDADFIFLVTEPTPFGLYDLQLAVETMRELNKPFAVVVNRMHIDQWLIHAYCEKENIELIAEIPDQENIAVSYSKGYLLYQDHAAIRDALIKMEDKINTLEEGKS